MKEFHNKINLKMITSFLLFLILSPSFSVAGGEMSGGGGYVFWRSKFRRTSPADAYLSDEFDKKPIGRMIDWNNFQKPDQMLCLDQETNTIQSVRPLRRTGEILVLPVEQEVEKCRWWRVDQKDSSQPKRFRTKSAAERWARKNSDAEGEPYCLDEDWYVDIEEAKTHFTIRFYAPAKERKNQFHEDLKVGYHHYQLFNCRDLRSRTTEMVSIRPRTIPEEWIQMAGGELSGGGGKRKRRSL